MTSHTHVEQCRDTRTGTVRKVEVLWICLMAVSLRDELSDVPDEGVSETRRLDYPAIQCWGRHFQCTARAHLLVKALAHESQALAVSVGPSSAGYTFQVECSARESVFGEESFDSIHLHQLRVVAQRHDLPIEREWLLMKRLWVPNVAHQQLLERQPVV